MDADRLEYSLRRAFASLTSSRTVFDAVRRCQLTVIDNRKASSSSVDSHPSLLAKMRSFEDWEEFVETSLSTIVQVSYRVVAIEASQVRSSASSESGLDNGLKLDKERAATLELLNTLSELLPKFVEMENMGSCSSPPHGDVADREQLCMRSWSIDGLPSQCLV